MNKYVRIGEFKNEIYNNFEDFPCMFGSNLSVSVNNFSDTH